MHVDASPAAVLGLVLGAAALTMSPVRALAQRTVPMKVTVTIGGRTETLRGTGRCAHEPRASLYGAAAALWLVEYTGQGQAPRVSLTFWRFAAGDEVLFRLAVDGSKGAHHNISTVKGARLEGSGRGTFQPTAEGGRFLIAGKTQNGAPLQATIECARFDGIAAEGG